jgi:hypothetical protein
MQITKEFLESEISELETEAQKAQTFLTQAQATIQAYKMLINRLEAPEPEQENGTDPNDPRTQGNDGQGR